MERRHEDALRIELTECIQGWLEEDRGVRMPYLGDDLAVIMASAALAVLLGIADSQAYLRKNDMLKEET